MDFMSEMTEEILEDIAPDWSTDGVDDSVLICPCGDRIEQDGECPRCGPSPLRLAGLI